MASPSEATVATFRAWFGSAFATSEYPDAVVERAIDEAVLIHVVRPLATLYLAAHLLTLGAMASSTGVSPGGPVGSATAGPLAIEYVTTAPASASDGWYRSTSYGARYLALALTSPRRRIGAIVVG